VAQECTPRQAAAPEAHAAVCTQGITSSEGCALVCTCQQSKYSLWRGILAPTEQAALFGIQRWDGRQQQGVTDACVVPPFLFFELNTVSAMPGLLHLLANSIQ